MTSAVAELNLPGPRGRATAWGVEGGADGGGSGGRGGGRRYYELRR